MFDAQCFNCGKMTQVPFKPDGKRPVYCLSCLKQIEEGKLIPLPDRMPSVSKAKYGSTLGDLGIEFAMPKALEQKQVVPASPASPTPIPPRTEPPEVRTDRDAPRIYGQGPRVQHDQRPNMGSSGGRPPRQDSSSRPQGDARRGSNAGKRDRAPERVQMSERDRAQPQQPSSAPGFRSQPVVRVPTGGAKVSLQSLKSSEKEKDEPPPDVPTVRAMRQQPDLSESRKEVNTADLRSILNQVMSEKKPDVKPENKKPADAAAQSQDRADDQAEPISEKDQSSRNILKPGDTIKF